MNAVFDAIMECGDAKKIDQLLAQLPQPKLINESDYKWRTALLPQLKLINESDYKGRTALHLAVEHGHYDVVEVLLGRGIHVASQDCGGFTPLHYAAELGHDKIVARLLLWENSQNPQIEPKCNDAETAFTSLVYQMSSGTQVTHVKSHSGLTALHLAAIRGRPTIVKQLLETKIELLNVGGKSALRFAIEHGREEIVEMLLGYAKSAGGDEEKKMFHDAIALGYDRVVAWLLVQSPELVHSVDRFGHSALELAALNGRSTILTQLLAQRPNSADVGGKYDGTVLHLAVEHGLDPVVAQLLVDKPALISEVDSHGRTALHLAVTRNKRGKFASQLLDKCRELIDVADRKGNTALQSAIYSSNFETKTVACLLAHRPAVLDDKMLWHVLSHATDECCTEVVKLFLEYKPELIRSVDHKGYSVLYRVFGAQDDTGKLFSEDLMQTVWDMNPDALHARNRGNTPFHNAIQSRNFFAIDLAQWKLSLDEIVCACVRCDAPFPEEELLEKIRGHLWESLNKDVVGIVFDYLGFGKRLKRRRDNDNEDSDDNEECDKTVVQNVINMIMEMQKSKK